MSSLTDDSKQISKVIKSNGWVSWELLYLYAVSSLFYEPLILEYRSVCEIHNQLFCTSLDEVS